MVLCSSALAGIDLSIEKDVVELGVTASVTDNTYLYVGGDSDEWLGVGLGYHTFVSPVWKLNAYYEHGISNDWLLSEMFEIDGVKTNTHLIELSASRFYKSRSLKFGVTSEFVRNGFTWITVDNANKYSAYIAGASYYNHIYVTGKVEHHYAEDKSDMLDFNQGQANQYEISIGTMQPIYNLHPFAKVTAFSPVDSYYGMDKTDYSWTVGARLSF